MMKRTYLLYFFASILILLSACREDETNNDPVLPSTYSFDNVSYSGQTARLDMLAELTSEMKRTNSGESIDEATLLNMFRNENDPFSDSELNTSGKQLNSKCYAAGGAAYSISTFEYLMGYLAAKSVDAGNNWEAGISAGVATSNDGSKNYFFDEYGVEYTQVIEKGLMGAVFYYQGSEVYTRDGKIGAGVDNETVTPGKGTDMEHHWDEAVGYLGIDQDIVSTITSSNFDTQLSAGKVRYHGKYAGKGHNAGLTIVNDILSAAIKGRWGISNNNYTYRDEAAIELREAWEMVLATTAIHYLNSANSNFTDAALRNHALSEAYAFVLSLYYNSDKKISNSELDELRAYFEVTIPGAPNAIPSFVDISDTDITAARDRISAVYGLDDVKTIL